MIRGSTIGDCRTIYAMICDLEKTELPFDIFRRIYQRQLESSDYTCFVYEVDGKMLGSINLRIRRACDREMRRLIAILPTTPRRRLHIYSSVHFYLSTSI